MAPQLATVLLIADMGHKARRQMAAIAGGAHGATQVIIVRQLVSQNRKAADLAQDGPAKRHRRAEARKGQAKAHARRHIGQKLIIDPHGGEARP